MTLFSTKRTMIATAMTALLILTGASLDAQRLWWHVERLDYADGRHGR